MFRREFPFRVPENPRLIQDPHTELREIATLQLNGGVSIDHEQTTQSVK